MKPRKLVTFGAFCSPSTGMKQMGETWFRNFLFDPQLHQLLEKVDADLAEEARREGCDCGGKLHRADYERKARGVPQWNKRYSFCCDQEDCRRRRTPESVRFLGRKVYAGLIVVLISAMMHGLKPERIRRIREVLNISPSTLKRWRQWWLDNFVRSSFWKAMRARFMPVLCEETLPWSLWVSFQLEERDRLLAVLQFLRPITAAAPGNSGLCEGHSNSRRRCRIASI
jgi:hypothetical protein